MSKEMGVILLGLLNIIVATNLLAVPGSWREVILVVSGLGLMALGFLLRAEVLSRGSNHSSFVENSAPKHGHYSQPQEEGLTSLN
jgi:hypothetical protein